MDTYLYIHTYKVIIKKSRDEGSLMKTWKKKTSKVAEPAKIKPKSQFLFDKNLPPRDFSTVTLAGHMREVLMTACREFYGGSQSPI